MPDTNPTAEAPKKSYIILQRQSTDWLQDEVNKYINAESADKKYLPYWPMMIDNGVFYQVMTLASLATQKVSITWWLWSVWPISWSITVSWGGE